MKWHDGKPFTAKDVQVHLARAARARTARRSSASNPRKVWYYNLKEVDDQRRPRGDLPSRSAPQPSFLMLLASGFSPVYPCHVSQRDMRTKPVGTGPFKFVEFKRNVVDQARAQSRLLEEGPALSRRASSMRIIDSRSTRILAFVAGEFDMTFDSDITVPLMKDMADAGAARPSASCGPTNVSTNLIVNRGSAAVRQPADPQGDGAGARPQGLHRHPDRGQGDDRRRHAAGARGPVGDAAGGAGEAAGLRRRRREEPGRGAQDHGGARLRRRQAAQGEGVDPQHRRSIATRP